MGLSHVHVFLQAAAWPDRRELPKHLLRMKMAWQHQSVSVNALHWFWKRLPRLPEGGILRPPGANHDSYQSNVSQGRVKRLSGARRTF